jgi:hypothetical protein
MVFGDFKQSRWIGIAIRRKDMGLPSGSPMWAFSLIPSVWGDIPTSSPGISDQPDMTKGISVSAKILNLAKKS